MRTIGDKIKAINDVRSIIINFLIFRKVNIDTITNDFICNLLSLMYEEGYNDGLIKGKIELGKQ